MSTNNVARSTPVSSASSIASMAIDCNCPWNLHSERVTWEKAKLELAAEEKCPCIDCRDPGKIIDRCDNPLVRRKEEIQHILKSELPAIANEKIIELSMHLVLREDRVLREFREKKIISQDCIDTVKKFPIYSTQDMLDRAEKREMERNSGMEPANRLQHSPLLDDALPPARDECGLFTEETLDQMRRNEQRRQEQEQDLESLSRFGFTPRDLEMGRMGMRESRIERRESRCRSGSSESFNEKAVASSCRVCSLKYGLRCISLASLFLLLSYLIISSIVETSEFWKLAARLNDAKVMQKVECNSTPGWIRDFYKKFRVYENKTEKMGEEIRNQILLMSQTAINSTLKPSIWRRDKINSHSSFSPEYHDSAINEFVNKYDTISDGGNNDIDNYNNV